MASKTKEPQPKGKAVPTRAIRKAIKGAAKQFKVKPYEVNKVQFWEHVFKDGTYGVTEWDVRKLGGFELVRESSFPSPAAPEKTDASNPLANPTVDRLSGHDLSKYIADVIGECAEAIGVAPHELTWHEFRRYINHAWGENSAGIARYNITRAGGFNQIRDAYFAIHPSQNVVDKVRLVEHANLNRRLGKAYAKKQFFLETAEEWSKRCFDGKIKPVEIPKGSKKTDRVVNVILSDLHIGSDISAEETGYQTFGRIEESRRLAALTKQICSYKHQYRASTKLVVHLIGDIIQGSLHDPRDGAVAAEQFARAVHLLSQMFGQLSGSFKQIDVHCATGNHGRNKARHFERAVHQKWDSVETEIYVALHYACSALKNVKFHIPKTPFCKVEVLGHKIFTTHGDTVLKPGMPGKAISMDSLEKQINKINASLSDADEYSIFAVGHVHTPSMTFLDNGAVMVTNGCMVPVDQFAVSIGVLESHCGQWIWETIKGHPMGDARLIKVGRSHDVDESLDAIIQPWQGLPS
jgi:predicted phosphodiesterase